MAEDQDRMRVGLFVRMGLELEWRARPVGCNCAGLHLGERPRDGFGVKQQECQCRVRKVEELVSIEVVDPLLQSQLVNAGRCAYVSGCPTYDVRLLTWPRRFCHLADGGALAEQKVLLAR